MSGNIKLMESSWNDAKGWIESVRQNFIQPIYPLLEADEYDLARKKITSLVNFCSYYIKKANKQEDIRTLKLSMNGLKSSEYRLAVDSDDVSKIKEIKSNSVQAIYNILELINFILADFDMFVKISHKKDWMDGIGSDD